MPDIHPDLYSFRQRYIVGMDLAARSNCLCAPSPPKLVLDDAKNKPYFEQIDKLRRALAEKQQFHVIPSRVDYTDPWSVTSPQTDNTQEATMSQIDTTKFKAAVKVKAESLAQKHVGSLVTVTLPSGAKIIDVLDGFMANTDGVHVQLQNVERYYEKGAYQLDLKSVVEVRALKPVPAARKPRR